MNLLGTILILILILSAIAAVIFFINPVPQLSNAIKNNPWTAGAVFVASIALIFNALTYFNANKLFIGQNTPLIDVTPIALDTKDKFTTVYFNISNYSGFTAYDIAIDLSLSKTWIAEWIKASEEKAVKQAGERLIIPGMTYFLTPGSSPRRGAFWSKLKPGETIGKGVLPGLRGNFDLQAVCPEIGKGTSSSSPVQVRVTWRNDRGHVFDEVHQYSLVCTLDHDKEEKERIGYAFTLIPEGIVSRKDSFTGKK